MQVGRAPGVAGVLLGLLIMSVGILVLAVLPGWGGWIHDYPASVLAGPLPPEAAPMVQALIRVVLGPLIAQVGSYIQLVGYFLGSLLVVLSLFPLGAGVAVLRMRSTARRPEQVQ